MGCFLSCFRGRPDPASRALHDPLVRKTRLGDAFLDDHHDDGTATPSVFRPCCRFNSDGHDGAVKHDQDTDEGTDDHVTEVESAARSSSQERSSGQIIRNQNPDPSDSPFPTPLVLRDDIQTPGFTTHQGNFKPGKRGRASKQFLYPVLRPIENKLQWTELRDESSSPVVASHPPKRRYLSADSTENEKPRQQTLPGSVNADAALSSESAPFLFHGGWKEQHAEEVACPEDENVNQQQLVGGGGVGELLSKSSENGKHGVASLSCWLKTTCADGEGEGQTGRQLGFGSVDLSDVPVFVASGLNWDNENNPTPMLPKAWDGNGIPNTTTKYKEDGVNCGVLEWVDAPWPVILQRCLTKLWDMYHEKNLDRVQDKEVHEIEVEKLKKELDSLGNQYSQLVDDVSKLLDYQDGQKSHDMDYTIQTINELKEKKHQLEERAKIKIQMEKLKLKKEQRKEIQVERDLLKEEKKKLEHIIAELLKAGHGCKEKLDKIKEVVMEE
ncbi:unnamed protein product [Triticum turgidum subsp. durum]|uniref:Uncharacterized protein n=1 Tax=Triticum turgidum subsp. durum TaxID=4567 RepID=A0A9R0XXA7_TRITD|nr:unnamed protein product [Triticum turgidum subsp. durum]